MRPVQPSHVLAASLLFIPVTLVAYLAGPGDLTLFPLSVVTLIPLAYLIAELTEEAGERRGAPRAGLPNAGRRSPSVSRRRYCFRALVLTPQCLTQRWGAALRTVAVVATGFYVVSQR